MTGKRVGALLFLLTLTAMPLLMFASGWPHSIPEISIGTLASGELTTLTEQSFKANFPLREAFSNLAWNLRYRTGSRELDGYFITGGGSVIKNVGAPNDDLVAANYDAILSFADQTGLPYAHFALLPTACAIQQQELPAFATLYNQKNFIEDVYKSFSGMLTTVNVYSALLAEQGKYLYYNTEDMLTPMGGYFAYSAMAPKLGLNARTPDQFAVEYPLHDYRGSLAARFPYATLTPDIISLYHYDGAEGGGFRAPAQYKVTHVSPGGSVTYSSLYRKECLTGPQPLDVYLGGSPPVLYIQSGSGPSNKLLILGDDTAKSYVPFLALHFSSICVVNVNTVTEEMLKAIDAPSFDRALFAFSTDTYMHSDKIQVLDSVW